MTSFQGTVRVRVTPGMHARIKPETVEGRLNAGKTFVVDGLPRDLCGTECVALNHLDGSRFSAAYDLSMLEITDTNPVLTLTPLQQALSPLVEKLKALSAQYAQGTLKPVPFGDARIAVLQESLQALAAVFKFPARIQYHANGEFAFSGDQGGGRDSVCQAFGEPLAAVLSQYETRTGVIPSQGVLPQNGWLRISHHEVERLLMEQSTAA